jgi:hypothetical protein
VDAPGQRVEHGEQVGDEGAGHGEDSRMGLGTVETGPGDPDHLEAISHTEPLIVSDRAERR